MCGLLGRSIPRGSAHVKTLSLYSGAKVVLMSSVQYCEFARSALLLFFCRYSLQTVVREALAFVCVTPAQSSFLGVGETFVGCRRAGFGSGVLYWLTGAVEVPGPIGRAPENEALQSPS